LPSQIGQLAIVVLQPTKLVDSSKVPLKAGPEPRVPLNEWFFIKQFGGGTYDRRTSDTHPQLGGFGSPINECTICSVGKGWFGIKE
jgi:hypothetical protein